MTGYFTNNTTIEYKEVGKCRFCKAPVGWLVSKKTGKKYPVNVDLHTFDTLTDTVTVDKTNFHKCKERDEAMAKK